MTMRGAGLVGVPCDMLEVETKASERLLLLPQRGRFLIEIRVVMG